MAAAITVPSPGLAHRSCGCPGARGGWGCLLAGVRLLNPQEAAEDPSVSVPKNKQLCLWGEGERVLLGVV